MLEKIRQSIISNKLLAFMLVLFTVTSQQAFAATDGVHFFNTETNSGTNLSSHSISISPSGVGETGIGAEAGGGAIAIGAFADAVGTWSIAQGWLASATADKATSIGFSSNASGLNSFAANGGAASGNNSISFMELSRAMGIGGIAIGNAAYSLKNGNISIGQNSRATGDNADAWGYDAAALGMNNLAIGRSSIVNALNSVAIGPFSQNFRDNTVSFGSSTIKRALTNLADGTQASDAATVGQVSSLATAAAVMVINNERPLIVNEAVTSANAYTDQAIANLANIDTSNLLALTGERAMIGDLQMGGNKITGLQDATDAQDAVTLSQMQAADQATLNSANAYSHSLVYQNNGTETGQLNVAADKASLTVTNSIGNTHGIVVDTQKTVISGGTTSTSLTLDDNGATFATIADGSPARVRGVANGVDGNDAVNVNQLNNAIAGESRRIDRLAKRLREVQREANGGVALAQAMSGSIAPDANHLASFNIGGGFYGGEAAIAANLNIRDEYTQAILGFGIGVTTTGEVGIRASATWQWNPTQD